MGIVDLEALLTPLEGIMAPARYLGGEINSPPAEELRRRPFRAVLCYPDLYELGMSHLGLMVLLEAGRACPDWALERVFAPAPDFAGRLRERRVPLFSLETRRPVREAHLLGFSLQTEATWTNVLEVLDLAGIPLEAAARGPGDPLVVAGGSGAFHAEPLAPFLDLLVLGDGEEAFPALLGRLQELAGRERPELLLELGRSLPWACAPSLYAPRRRPDGSLGEVVPLHPGLPGTIRGAVLPSLAGAPFPTRPLIPWVQSPHERVTVEIMRGCGHGCRFCEAGMTRRPRRLRPREEVVRLALASIRSTGYDEVSLLSLSASDHPELLAILADLAAELGPRRVGLALPSLRVGRDLVRLPEALGGVRQPTLTLAPEAATERLRRVIHKPIRDEDLLAGAEAAWAQGWRGLKLYFMVGLPTETDEDVAAIVRLAEAVSSCRGRVARGAGRVHVTVSTFVPRPWTPFQWEEMANPVEIRRRQRLLLGARRLPAVRLRFHSPERSCLEAVLSRGDRSVAAVLLAAWRLGARLDGWDEHFSWEIWERAFAVAGVDPVRQGLAARDPAAPQPWDHLSPGLSPAWLRQERERALAGLPAPSGEQGACSARGRDPGREGGVSPGSPPA